MRIHTTGAAIHVMLITVRGRTMAGTAAGWSNDATRAIFSKTGVSKKTAG